MNALILVDIQNDFLPGGALGVNQGDEIIPFVNHSMADYALVVATQDWHPAAHGSFASNHKGKKPGEVIQLNGLEQILWPKHCVQHTKGAEFSPDLRLNRVEMIFHKGTDPAIDSYSGFFDNGHRKSTGLGEYLKEQGVNAITCVGLATDYCVKFTALDGLQKFGFETTVLSKGTRAVNLHPKDYERALHELKSKGVRIQD